LELMTYKETAKSRIYNFIEVDESKGVLINRQLENRGGKIFMRSKVRFFESVS
jgi:hypothetical protein